MLVAAGGGPKETEQSKSNVVVGLGLVDAHVATRGRLFLAGGTTTPYTSNPRTSKLVTLS